jgi:hypothetical protein
MINLAEGIRLRIAAGGNATNPELAANGQRIATDKTSETLAREQQVRSGQDLEAIANLASKRHGANEYDLDTDIRDTLLREAYSNTRNLNEVPAVGTTLTYTYKGKSCQHVVTEQEYQREIREINQHSANNAVSLWDRTIGRLFAQNTEFDRHNAINGSFTEAKHIDLLTGADVDENMGITSTNSGPYNNGQRDDDVSEASRY